MSNTIQIRIDDKTKNEAKSILQDLGLDLSSAIKLYLRQIIIRQGIPFDAITENGLTIQKELEILRASHEAERGINVSEPMEAEEFIKHLEKLKNDNNTSQNIF